MRKLILIASLPVLMTGCLKTRNDVRENEGRQVMQQQVVSMQRQTADAGNRFADIEEQMRGMNGRLEVVEHRVGQSQSGVDSALRTSQQQNADLNQKVAILQDALTKMETQVFQLTAEVQALRAEKAAVAAQNTAKQAKKTSLEMAEEFFDKKDWKQAILNFQKYRDSSPKGKSFADATYKIGVSFQELGMKDEAKTFYDEVVNKFPKSDEARRAKIRLKSLKK